jgi:hypothetical protein
MNAQELQQAGFSPEEIQAYQSRQRMELKTAGFTDMEIDAKYGPTPASPPSPPAAEINDFFNVGLEGVAFDPVDGVPQENFADVVHSWVRPWQAVGYSSAESLNRGMATFATHLDTISEYIEKKTGLQKGDFFTKAAQQYNENTEYWKKRVNEVGISFFQELVSEAAGGAVPGITEFLLNVPYAAVLGAAEAEKAGENEIGAAILRGAKRGILGAVFHAMGPLQQYLRAPTMGAVFGTQAALEGADSREIAKSVGTGALYSLVSPGGRYGLNELKENARSYFEKDAKRFEEFRAGVEPPPAEKTAQEGVTTGQEGKTEKPLTKYSVETIDAGTIEVAVIRNEDGSVRLFEPETGFMSSEYNKAFSTGKTDEELIKYHYEPQGVESVAPFVPSSAVATPEMPDIRSYVLSDMVEKVKIGEKGGFKQVNNEGEGWTTEGIPSTYPEWFREISKKHKLSKDQFLKLADKVESGKPLTDKQQKVWDDVERAADNLEKTEYSGLQEEIALAEQGFVPVKDKVMAGDLEVGDEVMIKGDVFKVREMNQEGEMVLEDGTAMTPDFFDQIKVDAIKKPGVEPALAFAPKANFRRMPEEGPEAAEPMSRSSIADFLRTNLDIPIKTGRFNDRALGIYKVESEVIRTKQANDIEVIAHEVGHALQKFLFPESKTQAGLGSRPFSAYKNELDPLATQPKAGQEVTPEGFAEFIRLYITDVKQAQAKAPAFYNYFESLLELKAPEVKEIFMEARQRYDLYMQQPALKRVLSQVSVGEKDPERKINFSELYTKTIDDLHPLEKIVKEMAGGEKIPAAKDPYKLARLLRGWHGKAEAFLKNKPFDFDTYKDIEGAKSLKDILAPVKDNLDEFRAYIVSKRAIELDNRQIETGILREDAERLVAEYDKKYSKTFEDLKEFQDRTLTYLKQAGLLEPKAYEKMRQANQDYIPFYRVFEEQKNGGTGSGLQARNPVKTIKGSWRDIQDPLESIIKNTFLYINLAEKNAVGRALVDLAKSKEGMGKFVEKIPAPMKGIEVKAEELQDWLKKVGLEGEMTPEMLESDSLMIFRPNAFMPKDNVIAVWNKGKRELYEVHPEVARVFQALDKETTNTVLKIISLPASWLRAGATLTPEFIARNPLRDQWSAFINSKYGFVPGFDTVRSIFSMAKKDDIYWEWKKSGADHSMLVSMDRDYLQDNLGDLLQQYPLRNVVRNPINALRILSELGEAGTRIGEFRRGVEKEGETKEGIQAAGFASREVTLDFSRVGAQTRAVNSIIAFWNAQVQDIDKIARQFKENPLGTSVKVAASITLPSVLLTIANHDDPRFKEISQWQKDLFWIVCTDKNVWRIPKPFTLGILFGSVPERVTSYILDQDPKAFNNILETLSRGFSPGFYPTMLIPLTENWANKSMFFDRSIVPRSREDLLPEYQYSEFTTETAKGLGRLIGKFPGMDRTGAASPAYIENLIRGWTGGLGKYALDIADLGLRATGITKKEYEAPTKTLADIPLIKAFSIRFPSSGAASIEEFYENFEKTNQVNKTFKVLIEKDRNPEAALRLLRESGMEDLNGVHKALGNMRNVIDLVYRNPSMTGDEKRQLIDTIYLQMIQIAKQGNVIHERFEEYRKNSPKAAELRGAE